jgi:hypothetical protein
MKIISSVNFIYIFVCVGVMYSGECDICGVTLSVHPHRVSCIFMQKYYILEYIDIEGTRLSSEISPTRTDLSS